jgi:hypothetical protein
MKHNGSEKAETKLPPQVHQAVKDAHKHGEKKARQMGHDFVGKEIEGIKPTKADYTENHYESTKNRFKTSGQNQYGGKIKK